MKILGCEFRVYFQWSKKKDLMVWFLDQKHTYPNDIETYNPNLDNLRSERAFMVTSLGDEQLKAPHSPQWPNQMFLKSNVRNEVNTITNNIGFIIFCSSLNKICISILETIMLSQRLKTRSSAPCSSHCRRNPGRHSSVVIRRRSVAVRNCLSPQHNGGLWA